MRRVEAAGLVGASREEVWDLYDDLAGLSRWMPFVLTTDSISGPARVGTTWHEHRRTAGLPTSERWEITEHRRPRLQVRTSETGGLERTIRMTLESRGSGTMVHLELELRGRLPGPIGWLYELVAAIPGGWAIRASIHGAKRSFEGRSPR